MPRIVRLRTSADPGGGRGHLARALSLAEARWPDDVSIELSIAGSTPSDGERARATAAGAHLVSDRSRVPRGAVVIIDGPDPDRLAAGVPSEHLVVFDDSERFEGAAAVVVQPSQPSWAGQARARRILAGYHWAPIGADWQDAAKRVESTRTSGQPRVLVCFGGSDPHDLTGRIGHPLARDPRWATTIVVGTDYRGDLVDERWAREPPDLANRVAGADVVVIGAGTMKFEVALLGRPAILVAAADDQLAVGPPFAATGAAQWLGDGRIVDPEDVVAAVAGLWTDPPTRAAMSAAARREVDGLGADRLAAVIAPLAKPEGQARAS
jgi:hypothetical protein